MEGGERRRVEKEKGQGRESFQELGGSDERRSDGVGVPLSAVGGGSGKKR